MSWLHSVEIWYKLVEFCKKYNSFTTACQFITHVLGTFKFSIFGYYKAIIAQILTNFFLFSYKFDKLFSFLKQTGCFRPPVLK